MLYVKCSDQIISNKFGYHWLYKGHFLSKNWRFIDDKYKRFTSYDIFLTFTAELN